MSETNHWKSFKHKSPFSGEKEKKKRKIKNQENRCIPSHAVASSKEINESATSFQIHTLPDGMTVEVLVKGKPDGKVASPGKQVTIFENSDRDAE
ncbi:hypothetical protein K7X08_032400 [Anisodus acutangulus]|uniref:Uncharacterized protein n=1 Tax=Anisodus acutangulus TaxID=402998 RepID=A0A9Q1R9K1_9SOLA|nr:hypothetical protein K7X08_032400 [Anisodus acutangulus]